MLAEYGVTSESSPLITQDRVMLEDFRHPWTPERRAYGALPYFDRRDEIIAHFPEEAAFFSKHYRLHSGPEWQDQFYATGALLFEMKFGTRLSEFAKNILAHYPDRGHRGKLISVFGLSGSGKSTATDAFRAVLGADTVVIDSDTARYGLLAKMVRDAELAGGADADTIKGKLIHNDISGAFYFLLDYVKKELRDCGYTVVSCSAQPDNLADQIFYIEHPDGIDPRTISEEQMPAVAQQLFARTEKRIHGQDNYDWDHAATVLDFNAMKPVTVQVPERVHGIFLKTVASALEKSDAQGIITLKNPPIENAQERTRCLADQLQQFLKEF